MTNRIFILFFSVFAVFNCFGWGQKGHDVTAYIAEKHLKPEVLAHIDSILGNKSLVYYANWLDNASHTREYAYTKTWHYKNIDADVTYETAPIEPKGNVVTAINEQIAKLTAGNLTREDEELALRILIHIVGDMHQPMHMGRLSDLGGNLHKIKYFKRDTNLHSVWDGAIVESAHKWGYTEWQFQIDRASDEQEKEILKGTIDDWAKETYQIATRIYETTPIGSNLSYDYVSEWAPTIENQFLKGGLRLAYLLNTIYSK